MARLALFVDRGPFDSEWKGAFAWNIILSLAESQHEVLALTTLDPAELEVQHPRLTVARPAADFGVRHSPKWLRALIQFRPEVLHTFALQSPPMLSTWPLLEQAARLLPGLRRFSTRLSADDFAPFRPVDLPMEVGRHLDASGPPGTTPTMHGRTREILIPAPVSEWHRPIEALLILNEFLASNREHEARIIGGWGDSNLNLRREGWRMLGDVTQQIHMSEPMSFSEFMKIAAPSRGLWLRAFKPDSWRGAVASKVARQLDLPTWGQTADLDTGSTANFLSRLYLS